MSEVLERGQAGAPDSLWKTMVGKLRQIIVNTSTFRPAIHDGQKAGGYPLAFQSELLTEGPTLQQTAIDNALTSLGVYEAFEDLITEYGGTVPASLSETNAVSAQSASDPWADLN